MPSPRTEIVRRSGAVRWLVPVALLALAPKCLVCVWAYAGLGAALGFGGRELCGASASALDGWLAAFALAAGVLGICGLFIARRRH